MASPVFLEVLKDLQGAIEKVDQVKQITKAPELKNQLTMVGDGVGVLGWVTMDSKPGDVAAELFGGAQMYGNKVLKEGKESYVHPSYLTFDARLTSAAARIKLKSNGSRHSTSCSSPSSSTSRATIPRVFSGIRTELMHQRPFARSGRKPPMISPQHQHHQQAAHLRHPRRRRRFLPSTTFLLRRDQHPLARVLGKQIWVRSLSS